MGIIVVFLALLVPAIIEAISLKAPDRVDDWYRKGHMFNGIDIDLSNNYLSADEAAYIPMQFLFGTS